MNVQREAAPESEARWRLRAEVATLGLEARSPEAFLARATACLQELLGAAQVVFWRASADGCRFEATHLAPRVPLLRIAPAVFREVAASRAIRPVTSPAAGDRVRTCLLGPVLAGPSVIGVLQVVPRTPGLEPGLQESLGAVLETFAAGLRQVECLAQLRWQAGHDALTGLPNRRAWEAMLERETRLAVRHGLPLSVLVVDVDHFKRFNDLHGHAAGDALLAAVARRIAGCGRATDLVARWGGEEFVVLLPHTDRQGAGAAAHKLVEALRALEGAQVCRGEAVTASIGVATWPGDCVEASDLVPAADRAMYRAKREGRNRIAQGEGGLARP